MHTIVAFSDSHGAPLPQKLYSIANENDYVFFLGDGIQGLGDILLHTGFIGVNGNCDRPVLSNEEIIEIEGVKILLTHGHKYAVKRDLTSLSFRARELGCNAVFYGHTHFADITENDGITYICPGSVYSPRSGMASYAYTVIHNGKINAKIVNLI